MNFTEHYYIDEEQLNEGLFDFKKSPILKLLGGALTKGWNSIKPTTIKLSKISNLIDPSNIIQTTKNAYNKLMQVITADLSLWREESADKGFVDKFVLKVKTPFIKDLKFGVVDDSMIPEIKKTFGLSRSWIIDSINVYKTTNGGNILLMAIVDPYEGKIKKPQNSPKSPRKIEKEYVNNTKYYIALDKKAEKWFINKKNVQYKQYISMLSNYSYDQLAKEIDAEMKKYKKELGVSDETKTNTSLPDAYKAEFTKLDYDAMTSIAQFNLKRILEKNDNFKSAERIKATKNIKDGWRIFTKDGGAISIFTTVKDEYKLTTNEKGKEALEKYDVTGARDFTLTKI
jgi:hypothetical protein